MTKETIAKLYKRFNFNLDSLDERIRVQKTVFLLMKLKFPNLSDYRYGLYIYGPYATQVAADAFAVRDEQLAESAGVLSTDEERIVKKFLDMLDSFDKVTNGQASKIKYELFADIIFLKEQGESKMNTFNIMAGRHSYLNNQTFFDSAYAILTAEGLI